jgi:hypothetical protein
MWDSLPVHVHVTLRPCGIASCYWREVGVAPPPIGHYRATYGCEISDLWHGDEQLGDRIGLIHRVPPLFGTDGLVKLTVRMWGFHAMNSSGDPSYRWSDCCAGVRHAVLDRNQFRPL